MMSTITKNMIRDRHFFSVITSGVFAEVVAVCQRTVHKWCDSGKLPNYRLPDDQPDRPGKGGTDRRIRIGDAIRFCRERGLADAAIFLLHHAKPSVVVAEVPEYIASQVEQSLKPYQVTLRQFNHVIHAAADIGSRPTVAVIVGGWTGTANLTALFSEADASADRLGWICGKVIVVENGETIPVDGIRLTPATMDHAMKQLAPFLPLRTEVFCDGDSCRQADCGTCSAKQDDTAV